MISSKIAAYLTRAQSNGHHTVVNLRGAVRSSKNGPVVKDAAAAALLEVVVRTEKDLHHFRILIDGSQGATNDST